jgi:thiol-disulfide isomerase/thioredoxin
MKKTVALVMIVTLCLLTACNRDKGEGKGKGGQPQAPAAAAAEGGMAPDFSVKDLNGTEVRLSTLKGKVVMVNFWATWCPPCKEEIPSMMKLNKSLEGKPFQMLAISIDEGGKAAVEKYFRSSGNQLPAYLDPEGNVSSAYGITGVPETFIVDKSGRIKKKIVGGMDWGAPDVLSYLNELMNK